MVIRVVDKKTEKEAVDFLKSQMPASTKKIKVVPKSQSTITKAEFEKNAKLIEINKQIEIYKEVIGRGSGTNGEHNKEEYEALENLGKLLKQRDRLKTTLNNMRLKALMKRIKLN